MNELKDNELRLVLKRHGIENSITVTDLDNKTGDDLKIVLARSFDLIADQNKRANDERR